MKFKFWLTNKAWQAKFWFNRNLDTLYIVTCNATFMAIVAVLIATQ